MAARKKKAVDETAATAEQSAVSEPVENSENAAEAAAEATGEPAEDAETGTASAQTAVPPDVASAQALAFPYNRTLKYGADGEDVLALQTALLASGLDVTISGVYDLRTVRAVQQLQRQKGQPASGIIGKHDYTALLGSE